ncbi:metallophosphoesterase family protein [Salinibacter altiplanensis]|uniref:metallophosphoesterase family protein n=1 Tax=Salinibacter altiplanensis TaxID=1803181 RepID=UPI000C9F507A|nr:DNA repair exonuclease [Salinibacter altiplanensis]
MADAPCRILCTGDLHLGRYPSRTHSRDRAWAVDHVWEDTVSYAVQQAVDVVVLTGDVVDAQNKRYEALGPLQRGLRRLGEAGIPVVAVAGNHDFDALPCLAGMIEADHFHLLGRGGKWGTLTVAPEGRAPLQFVGWSFREAHTQRSPVESFPDGRLRDDVPTVGLLHADLNAPESVYAPVSLDALRRRPVSAWLLGHIHAPSLRDDRSPLVLYPGSLQPLDPSETGTHGPWRVEVAPDGDSTATHLPRAPLRYEHLDVDVDAMEEGAVEAAVTDAMRDRLRAAREKGPTPQRLVCRLTLTGRTSVHRAVCDLVETWPGALEVPVEGSTAIVESAAARTRPALDLKRIAEGTDPPAVLAQLLLAVRHGEEDEPAQDAWVAIKEACSAVQDSPAYGPLSDADDLSPDREALADMVQRQGLLLLDELRSQTDAAPHK